METSATSALVETIEPNAFQKPDIGFNSYRIKVFILSLTMFCSIGPFFVWSNLYLGIGFYIFKFLELLTIVILLTTIDKKYNYRKRLLGSITIFGIFLFLAFFTGVKGGTYLPITAVGNVVTFTSFALLIMAEEKCLFDSFNLLKTIFTVVIAYTLIIHLLVLVHVPIPSTVLASNEEGRTLVSGQSYLNYLGCLFIQSPFIIRMERFTSVFSEPGVVGTISAFFLVADDFRIKKDKRNLVLLVGGIFSLSLAFILLSFVSLLLRQLQKGAYRTFWVMFILLLTYLLFMNITFSNRNLSSLQQRLTYDENRLLGDNRIKEYAQLEYEDFLQGDLKTVLLGYGNAYENPTTNVNFWQGSATYKRQVFQYGVIGFGIYLLWIIFVPYNCFKTKDKAANNRMIVYIVAFVASIYQRPNMSTLFFLYFLIAGCVFAKFCIRSENTVEASQ